MTNRKPKKPKPKNKVVYVINKLDGLNFDVSVTAGRALSGIIKDYKKDPNYDPDTAQEYPYPESFEDMSEKVDDLLRYPAFFRTNLESHIQKKSKLFRTSYPMDERSRVLEVIEYLCNQENQPNNKRDKTSFPQLD